MPSHVTPRRASGLLSRLAHRAPAALLLVLAACGGGSGDGTTTPPPPPVVTAATAAFSAAGNATANQAIVFDASASTSSDGSALSYSWDFGDGQHGGGKTIARSFATAGTHTVTLTVVDGVARSATRSHDVAVTAAAAGANVTVNGHITGLDGTAIEGVVVTPIGSSATATSDAMGGVDLSVPTGVPVSLKLTKAGLADQFVSLTLPLGTGSDAYFEATLRPRDAAQTLADAAAGGSLAGRDGAGVSLPAGALVDGSGTAVGGPVQISITPVDVTQPFAGGFPGAFDGIRADGTTTPIVSFGTVEFAIYAGANRLQLGAGKTATIVLPIYAAKRPDGSVVAAGDTIPLWSLDETTSIWIQEGTGTVIASADSPSGLAMQASVSHFSWWNSDIGFSPFGPQPKCVYDTDSGIPGGEDTFATATICNMLADMDRGGGAAAAARARPLAAPRATPLPPQIAGYSRRVVLPIAGGVTIPVPANLDVDLNAIALNGTWSGRAVVNGPVGLQEQVLVKMRPIASTGTTPEAIVIPFDSTRSLQTGQTALYSFSGSAAQFASITISDANGSNLSGHVRLLQGTTALASGDFTVFGGGSIVYALPADGTYLVEVTGTANTPGAYRLQVDLLGGRQSESIAFAFDVTKSLGAYASYRGSFAVGAATIAYIGYNNSGGGAHLVRVAGSDGSTLYSANLGAGFTPLTIALPAAGTYSIDVAPVNAQFANFRVTGEPTQWQPFSPGLAVSSFFAVSDLHADRNGAPVVGVFGQTMVAGRTHSLFQLRRWSGSAWQSVGPDIDGGLSCNGFERLAFAFDSTNQPVVVSVAQTLAGGSVTAVQKLVAGAWTPVGPNGGALPAAGVYASGCQSTPKLVLDTGDAPIVAYRSDNAVVIQRFDGNNWLGLASASASDDSFYSINGDFDLRFDPSNQLYFALSASGVLTVQRFTSGSWQSVGPNGGPLPQPGITGLNEPQIGFDGNGSPVVASIAGVGIGVWSSGVALHRFDGSTWTTSGGYQAEPNSYLNNTPTLGFAIFRGDPLVAWSEQSRDKGIASPIVQRNTAAGWSAFGPDIGEIPQFTPHAITPDVAALGARLLVVGGVLYQTIIVDTAPNYASPAPTLVLLRYVGP